MQIKPAPDLDPEINNVREATANMTATGGLTYAEMGRYATADGNPKGTNDANEALKDANGRPVPNSLRDRWVTASYVGPLVIGVRGPSRSGKTSIIERLVREFESHGLRVAYLKRSHHELDLPEKASGRVWANSPSAMVLRAADRLQLTLPAGDGSPASLIALLPPDIDLVLLETHTPEPYPTVLAAAATPAPGEDVIASWEMETVATAAAAAAAAIRERMPGCPALDHALRAAMRLHGGHACAGLILGARLALTGAAALGIEVPDNRKRLVVIVETDRCAVDAIQAVTGCRPGKRTLRLLDYGKLAATFIDQHEGEAVRVAARGDLRQRAGMPADRHERHKVQRLAYLAMTPDELFAVRPASADIAQFDLPGPPRSRVTCVQCGEEVSDGREIVTELGERCRPCTAELCTRTGKEGGLAPWR